MDNLATTIVDLQPLLETFITLVGAVVLTLGTLAVRHANKWLEAKTGQANLVNEEIVRSYLHKALDTSVEYAKAKAGGKMTVDVKNAMVAEATEYAVKHVPDAIAYFKLTPEDLERLIVAKLGK